MDWPKEAARLVKSDPLFRDGFILLDRAMKLSKEKYPEAISLLCNAIALGAMYSEHPRLSIDEIIEHLKDCPAYLDDMVS